jgi:hypothetical protein
MFIAAASADNLNDTLAAGSVTNPTINEGGSFSTTINYQVEKTGNNNTSFPATVNFALSGAPAWASLNATSRTFTGYSDVQSITVSGTAPSGSGGATYNFSVEPSTSAANLNATPAKVNMSVTVNAPSPSDTTSPDSASVVIDNGAAWTNSTSVVLDLAAHDAVGVTRYRLAGTQAGLASATDVPVSPAQVNFSADDVAFTLSTGDSAAKSVWARFCDAANNCTDASDTIGLDTGPPMVSCNAASFILNEPGAQVSASVTDTLSGPLNNTEYGTAGTSSVGLKNVSITGYDNAGNSTTASCSYTVGYNFAGLFAPIDKPNTMNVSKAGQAIPLKWRLTDYIGSPVTNLGSAVVTVSGISCNLGSTDDLVEEVAAGSSGLQNLGDGYYQVNWKSPTSYAGSCKSLNLNLGEGAMRTNLAYISFKK